MRVDELPDSVEGINRAMRADRTRRRWARCASIERFFLETLRWTWWPIGLAPRPSYHDVASAQREAEQRRAPR